MNKHTQTRWLMHFQGKWSSLYEQLEPDIRKQVSYETFTKLKTIRPLRYQSCDWLTRQEPFDEPK